MLVTRSPPGLVSRVYETATNTQSGFRDRRFARFAAYLDPGFRSAQLQRARYTIATWPGYRLYETATNTQSGFRDRRLPGSIVQSGFSMNITIGLSPRWNEKAGVDGMRYAAGHATCGAKETSHEEA